MLPRRQKLSRNLFPTPHDPKTTWVGDVLLIRLTKTKAATHPRFAVVVSKKNCKLATKRNSLRREIYRKIQQYLSHFTRFSGAKFVILISKNNKVFPTPELIEEDIKKFLISR